MKTKNIVHSIRFDEATYNLIKAAASQEGMSFATFMKSATVTYIQNASAFQEILTSINPDDLDSAQKTFSDSIHEVKESISSSVVGLKQSMEKRLNLIETILRRSIYAQFYFAPKLAEEEKSEATKRAKINMERLLKEVEGEVSSS